MDSTPPCQDERFRTRTAGPFHQAARFDTAPMGKTGSGKGSVCGDQKDPHTLRGPGTDRDP